MTVLPAVYRSQSGNVQDMKRYLSVLLAGIMLAAASSTVSALGPGVHCFNGGTPNPIYYVTRCYIIGGNGQVVSQSTTYHILTISLGPYWD